MPKYLRLEKMSIVETAPAASKEGGMSLQYPVLNKTNYTAWATRMKFLMKAQGVWEAIEPTGNVAVDVKKEEKAMAIISQALSDVTLMQVAAKNTALKVWTALRTMHMGADRAKEAKIQTLRWEFENLSMDNTELVDDFATKVTLLVGQMQALGEKIEEKNVVKRFLRAVSDKFIHIATTIEYFGDVNNIALEEVIGSLKAYEERTQHRHRSNGDEEHLLLTKAQWEARSSGQGGGRDSKTKRDKSHIKCFNCSDYRHYASECRKPKRDRGDQVNLMCAQEDEPTLL